MHCAVLTLALAATAAQAASITMWSLDDVPRTVHFVPNPGSANMPPVQVAGKTQQTVQFEDAWAGNFYAVAEGQPQKAGMLGEVQFKGWNGLTYFDVSAIVDPNDTNNVKQMFPAISHMPMSGCVRHPCDNCYLRPDDLQTKSTPETDLYTTLGEGETGINFGGYLSNSTA